jgi:hypothetical protein
MSSARVCLALGLLFVSAAAPARPPEQPPKPTNLRFDDPDLVEVPLLGPGDGPIYGRPPIKHSRLIKVRENFLPELLKSAEDR